ncbi:DUF58 domain-containing protein [uncultured Amnibacterium sp.]|uniref:DUF58 domain-containing protein n=1 Tax=uncultured Amnibacterium sp. TaxID=1631851 RepID=UPI0035CBDC6E
MELPSGLQQRLAPVRLTVRGGVFLGVGLLGVIIAYAAGWQALLAVSLFLWGAVLAAVGSVVVSPPSLTVERRIEPGIVEQRRQVVVDVRVRGSAPGALEWTEDLPRSVVVTGHAEGVLRGVRADRPAEVVTYAFAARVRGAVPIGPLRVARVDPLGLATTKRRVGGVDRVIVLPRIVPVELPFAVRRNDPDTRATTVFGAVGDQRDIIARGYRSGDPVRVVDWRATARRGELMVRTETAASTSATGLLLDTRAESWPEAAAFEWAVDYAASLVAALEERHAAVRLAAGGLPVSDATSALVALATVERGQGDPAPAELLPVLATNDVQIVHVLTGAGGAHAVPRLPALPSGARGMVSVISRHPLQVDGALGWTVVQRDSAAAAGSARDA